MNREFLKLYNYNNLNLMTFDEITNDTQITSNFKHNQSICLEYIGKVFFL
jgi:hypothetical protein